MTNVLQLACRVCGGVFTSICTIQIDDQKGLYGAKSAEQVCSRCLFWASMILLRRVA